MPLYRIPFYGTILVEADTLSQAEVSAGTWVRSMKQATHGVKVDPPSADSICAVDLWIHQQPTDVTKSFAAYLEKDRAFRETLDEEAKGACRHDYDVGVSGYLGVIRARS